MRIDPICELQRAAFRSVVGRFLRVFPCFFFVKGVSDVAEAQPGLRRSASMSSRSELASMVEQLTEPSGSGSFRMLSRAGPWWCQGP